MHILVHHFLRDSARDRTDKTALIVGETRHTFGEIDRASDAVACALQADGVARGDRVALALENSAEFVIAVWGILKAGAVFVPVNPTTKADKLAYILNDCGVKALVAQASLARQALPALDIARSVTAVLWVGDGVPDDAPGIAWDEVLAGPRRNPTDPGVIDLDLCAIIYTSGSTGRPKGVMLTHRNMINTAWSISTYLGNVAEDVVICLMPLSFDYGLYQVVTGARVGFTVVLEKSFAYPFDTIQTMARHRVTGLPGVPTIFATLLQMEAFEKADLSSLRYISNTAAAFPPAHIRRLRQLQPHATVFSMYGLTECTRVAYLDPARLDDKITSVGKAIPNSETWIVDEVGNRVGPGEVGELVIRGSNVMRGYWGKPDESARRLKDGPFPGEKVLYSGDLFWADAEGFLHFVARKDDVFKCKGEKVSPKEIENVLYELDSVAEACIVGVPDNIDGTAIKAYVVPRQGSNLTEAMVRQHCRARLESYLVPKFVEISGVLPKTESGKIKRTALAEFN
ncbi:MAG TPA: AMP-binding protein [Azospirillaceae bacterium]|nr:AMP-binding protein [Azospirillaceae bacterium]